MRLINIFTLEMKEFGELDFPCYAILSHTWEGSEITYEEFVDYTTHQDLEDTAERNVSAFRGYQKIVNFCKWLRAPEIQHMASPWRSYGAQRPMEWAWVDTCCIDKRSTAELSEAINSMFEWYRRANLCVAYLSDITRTSGTRLAKAKWFMRGWTLQELLAPRLLILCDANWLIIGHKCTIDKTQQNKKGECSETSTELSCLCEQESGVAGPDLNHQIATITKIDEEYLVRSDIQPYLQYISIAEKMRWAARRSTTRIEDVSYCLLGLFQVYMPLLYGEGVNAFQRLQHELIRNSKDQSIFTGRLGPNTEGPILANSPLDFAYTDISFTSATPGSSVQHEFRQGLVHIRTRLYLYQQDSSSKVQPLFAMPLNCYEHRMSENKDQQHERGQWTQIEITLAPPEGSPLHYSEQDTLWLDPDGLLLCKVARRPHILPKGRPRVDLGMQNIRVIANHWGHDLWYNSHLSEARAWRNGKYAEVMPDDLWSAA